MKIPSTRHIYLTESVTMGQVMALAGEERSEYTNEIMHGSNLCEVYDWEDHQSVRLP
jgi:hypothetical protein